jgi:hypothetical protein
MDLGPGMCHWPSSGEARDGNLMFCGAKVEPGARFPYCSAHHSRAVSPRVLEPLVKLPE